MNEKQKQKLIIEAHKIISRIQWDKALAKLSLKDFKRISNLASSGRKKLFCLLYDVTEKKLDKRKSGN